MTHRIGLIVNPVAGMGGAVALKGTDDVEAARARGAEPVAPERARRFVRAVRDQGADVLWLAAGAPMGEDALEAEGESALVPYAPHVPTTAEDTREAARAIAGMGVDVLVFVGGDGTAADVAAAVDGAGGGVPVLGVPAGVKMYSGVFAETPERAAVVALTADAAEAREVLDIDEAAFRRGELRVRLAGHLRVPVHRAVQAGKVAGADAEVERETLAEAVARAVREAPGVTHVLGAGGTMQAVKAALGFEGTLLGVDAWRDGTAVAVDAAEADLLKLPGPLAVWVSPLGGHGFILGRGNQQLSPAVLERAGGPEGVRVVATPTKLAGLDALRVDTGDPALDARFPKFLKVLTGYRQSRVVRVRS